VEGEVVSVNSKPNIDFSFDNFVGTENQSYDLPLTGYYVRGSNVKYSVEGGVELT
jgi:hypothetical protein